nr:PilX N-terminal domain-containing pilus assembly protein [Tepidimonas alkaliphilus]
MRLGLAPQPQRGAALIVALIILLMLTLIGAATVQTAIIQEKLAGSSADRQRTFQAAEWALRWAEQWVWNNANSIDANNVIEACEPETSINDSAQPAGFTLRYCAGRATAASTPCGPASSNQRRCDSFIVTVLAQPDTGETAVKLESILLLEQR